MIRVLTSLTIGSLCGAVIGATSYAIAEKLFGRGIGILTSSPLLAATIGVVFMGVPSLIVGAVGGGSKASKSQSAVIGLIVGAAMVLLFVVRDDSKYFYESGYFDRELFWYNIIMNLTWLAGLPLTGVVVSFAVRRLFPQDK